MSNEHEHKKDLGEHGSEDTLKGKLKEAAGKVQSAVGKATDNPKTEARGDAKQVEGKTQNTVGHTERKIDNALDPNK
ncbi:CsbD family protein [Dictyobacter alpinus]|uniref:CsbD family protein n=1 Tax=Dictyobacter alpinus TaxID=2014873 RepID=A0A402B089_9CHLR|nr:CsbD family protein [Dictyobacter alpinus]GCE24762.1 CsbD family protein [Dictyobacter alpinus]